MKQDESDVVVARAEGWSLPHMDENTSALIEAVKTRIVVEEKLRLCEEKKAAKEKELQEDKDRQKQKRAAAKEEKLKLEKESAARRQQVKQELLSFTCRAGNAAFSAGNWTR